MKTNLVKTNLYKRTEEYRPKSLFFRRGTETRQEKMTPEFGKLLESQIPRLRRYARALTRDTVRADDLVQDCLVRAVAKSHLWQPGTDLRAWLFTILHNTHVNTVRKAVREGVNIDV